MTMLARAHLNRNAALYVRNAVLGPYTAEDGPCPNGTMHSDASGTKIRTSKHTALREFTTDIIHSQRSDVNLRNPLVSFIKIPDCEIEHPHTSRLAAT